jgi:GNAT superfamily N-acetyltransferase
MQFELDSALLDQILFYMEDQGGDFVLDTRKRIVLAAGDSEYSDDGDDRYISLPEWRPADGFRLMEKFAAVLKNPLVREELSAALDRGRGVFRAFKNTLARYPETEKLWFAYKEREMKRVVIAWYNGLRESWGLELIGEEPEDLDGLALEDFRFRAGTESDAACAEQLHRACLEEYGAAIADSGESDGQAAAAEIFSGMGEWAFPGGISFVAETADGEFVGYASAINASGETVRVCAVEVKPEYRGLGLGKALIGRLLEHADGEKIPRVIIDLPAGQEYFSRVLLRENFKPRVQRYCRDSNG